jgi:hypothetical protein
LWANGLRPFIFQSLLLAKSFLYRSEGAEDLMARRELRAG